MEKIGELKAIKKLAKKVKEPSAAQKKLLDVAALVRLDPDDTEAAFMARQLVQCTLPHSNPGGVPIWSRNNGRLTLTIQPGYDHDHKCLAGYPYGSIPRLLLFWIITEAVRTKSRYIELGRSLNDFMRDVGLDPLTGGGKRGDAKRLREQMGNLFRCKISFDYSMEGEDGTKGHRWLDMQVAPAGEFWWDFKEPEQSAFWHSWLELGEHFFKAISLAPVPVDKRALRGLKRSPLALDLYTWATYRAWCAKEKGRSLFVSWDQLAAQLGGDYGTTKNFKVKVRAALRKVKVVYSGFIYDTNANGLTVYPCGPVIAPKQD